MILDSAFVAVPQEITVRRTIVLPFLNWLLGYALVAAEGMPCGSVADAAQQLLSEVRKHLRDSS